MHLSNDMTTGDARSALEGDHERLEQLMTEVLLAFEENDRETLVKVWTCFNEALLRHLELEEQLIIPEVLRDDERTARSILEEHRYIRSRLVELGAEVNLHTVRMSTARAFIADLQAHARHEDKQLYPWAAEYLRPERQSASTMSKKPLARVG